MHIVLRGIIRRDNVTEEMVEAVFAWYPHADADTIVFTVARRADSLARFMITLVNADDHRIRVTFETDTEGRGLWQSSDYTLTAGGVQHPVVIKQRRTFVADNPRDFLELAAEVLARGGNPALDRFYRQQVGMQAWQDEVRRRRREGRGSDDPERDEWIERWWRKQIRVLKLPRD